MNSRQMLNRVKDCLGIRQKPLTIQMPITSRCNSRCKTCNVWKHKDNTDIDPVSLKRVLSDPYFSEVTGVGINGGEFTLAPNFIDIIDAVLSLPKINSIYLITNGLFPKRLYEYLREAYMMCKQRSVIMHLCLSVDGVEDIHEHVRGIPNCFSKTKNILDTMFSDREQYCSSFSVGCTISIHNVEYLNEVQSFFDSYPGLEVEYHCAIPNKRIDTFDDSDYYVLNDDRKRLLAAEFFYEQYLTAQAYVKKYQYFANFYFLKNGCRQRLNLCSYLNRDITIDENLNFSLCATASDVIGNLKEKSITELIGSRTLKNVRKQISKYCKQCGHYSYNPLNIRGRLAYIKELLRNDFIYTYYSIYSITNPIVRLTKRIRLYLRIIKHSVHYTYLYLWKLQ